MVTIAEDYVFNRSKLYVLPKLAGYNFEPISESQTVCKTWTELIEAMSADDKLVKQFEMMYGFSSQDMQVQNIEQILRLCCSKLMK